MQRRSTTNTLSRIMVSLLILILIPSVILAQDNHGQCDPPESEAFLDYNNVRAAVYNDGSLFWNGGQHTYNVPKSEIEPRHSVFMANLWIGGLVDGELRKTGSAYGYEEMWPGPIDDEGNAPADCSEYDRLYKISVDDLIAYNNGANNINPDFLEWPVHLGAPVIDGDGIPDNYNLLGGDRPKILGHQNIWWIMNDNGNKHQYGTDPLGVEVWTTAFSIKSSDHLNNTTFYKYEIKNRSKKTIKDMYSAVYVDPEIGYWGDDIVGSDSLLGLGFAYNDDEFDDFDVGYGERPPAIGIDFVDGPLADADAVDNNFNGVVDEEGEKIQMTNFHVHHKHAYNNGYVRSTSDYYNYMRTRLQDGSQVTKGKWGLGFSEQATNFMYSGKLGEYWSMENVDGEGTKYYGNTSSWMVNSIGPFDLEPEESISFTIAVLWARGNDRLDSVRLLKEVSAYVQGGIDAGAHENREYLASLIQSPNADDRQIQEHKTMGVGEPYPNPSSGHVNLSYTVTSPTLVEISVFDIHGRLVKTLLDAPSEEGTKTLRANLKGFIPGQYFMRYHIAGAIKYFPITLLP